jgi:hypothetical protein
VGRPITNTGGDKMEEEKIAGEINKGRIVLSNGEIFSLANPTPFQTAFVKVQNACPVSGKTYYWVYKFWTKTVSLFKKADEDRVALAKKYGIKNEDGSIKVNPGEYQFSTEQKALYDKEMEELNEKFKAESESAISSAIESKGDSDKEKKDPIALVLEKREVEEKTIALKYCTRDQAGNPVPLQRVSIQFTPEGMQKFQEAFNELLKDEITYPMDKIKIDSSLLEKMNNNNPKNIISINDMMMLERIFDFVE